MLIYILLFKFFRGRIIRAPKSHMWYVRIYSSVRFWWYGINQCCMCISSCFANFCSVGELSWNSAYGREIFVNEINIIFNFLRSFSKIIAANIHFLILPLILFKISIWLKSMWLISIWLTHMCVWNLINTSIFLRYENWKQQRVKQYLT